MKPIGLMSLAFAVALTVGCGRGDVQKDSATIGDNSNEAAVGTSGEADRGTKQFVQDLTEAGTAEVQLGQLATQRAAARRRETVRADDDPGSQQSGRGAEADRHDVQHPAGDHAQ